MSLKHGLLGLLNYGSMSGYDLSKAFRDSLALFWQAKSQQIYRELDAMERNGWLTSERVIQHDKPNKRVYSITDTGKQELLSWLSESEAGIADVMRVKSAFLMRVFFAGEISADESLALLYAYREKCLESIKDINEAHSAIIKYETEIQDDSKTRYWKIAALYGDKQYHAALAWADEAIAILEGEHSQKRKGDVQNV